MKATRTIGACVFGLALALTTAAQADYVSDVLADNPVVYLRLGENAGTTADDQTANNFDGDYQNGPTLGVAGIAGGGGDTAVSLDGSNDRVQVSGANVTTDYTVEAWVNVGALPGSWSNVVYRSNTANEAATFADLLQINSAGKVLHYTYAGGAKSILSTNAIQVNAWNHIVGVYQPGAANAGANIAVWVNGVETSNTSVALGNPYAAGNEWLIGQDHGNHGFLNGSVDEFAAYDTALDDASIFTHYLLGSGQVEVEAVADAAGLAFNPDAVVYAVNVSADNAVRTVNGIAFNPTDGPLGPVPGVAVASNQSANNWGTLAPEYGAGADNDALEDIMHDIRYGSGGDVEIDIDVTSGLTYKLTMMFSENHATVEGAREFDIEVEGLLLIDAFDVLEEAGGQSKLVTVTYLFEASDANLDINLLFDATNPASDNNPIINALVLEVIPTPAALPAGLAMLGLAAARRRRRK